MHKRHWLILLLITGIAGSPDVAAQNTPESDFKKLTLEELMDVNVTSVSRKAEPLARTAAAIAVITAEDIRRTGVTSIPEALRLVPGLQVARFNAGSWAISARGFNSTAANKLLVLIDGRTVYSPLFSGTFWEVQDLILDDIARIEVVRGPGATLWGSNAVNGVINIITKSAHQTQNTAVILTGGGAEDLALGSFRAGGAFNANTSYRVFAKYVYRDQMVFANGDDAKDSVRIGRTGFRVDAARGKDEFTLQSDVYRGLEGIAARADAKVLGGDVLGRWNRKISLARDRIRVQFGSKFEHNAFTGFEAQPSIRASWAVRNDQFIWAAVSRAVRTPTRFDSDIRFGPPALQFVGNPDFNSEEVVAFEFGYRSQPARRLSLDLATYINVYDRIRSLELQPAPGVPSILILNNLDAKTYGGELAVTYDVLERLRFTTGYSYLSKRLTPDPGHVDAFGGTIEGNDPRHQFLVRGSADLGRGVEWDATWRFVDRLPNPVVPRYFELDQTVGWSPTGTVELSIIGRNLLHRHHPEFGPATPGREEVQRDIYGRVALRF